MKKTLFFMMISVFSAQHVLSMQENRSVAQIVNSELPGLWKEFSDLQDRLVIQPLTIENKALTMINDSTENKLIDTKIQLIQSQKDLKSKTAAYADAQRWQTKVQFALRHAPQAVQVLQQIRNI